MPGEHSVTHRILGPFPLKFTLGPTSAQLELKSVAGTCRHSVAGFSIPALGYNTVILEPASD